MATGDDTTENLPLTLPALAARAASRYGDRTAFVTPYGRWSFAQLHESALRTAHRLRRHGLRPGDRIAICAPNGEPWFASVFGAAAAGAVPVLLHVLLTAEDIDAAVALTGCRHLLLARQAGRKPILAHYLARHPEVTQYTAATDVEAGDDVVALVELDRDGRVTSLTRWTDKQIAAPAELPLVQPDDDGLILFTSGTSGTPKAVRHAHHAPCRQVWPWIDAQLLRADDAVFTAYPFCWSSGFVRALCAALTIGAKLVTVDHLRPEQALLMIERERCTKIVLPGAHLDQRLIASPEFRSRDLSSVRVATPTLARALGVAPIGYTGYGMTETFTLVTAGRLDAAPDQDPKWVGPVLPGWTVRIADFDSGEPVRPGATGRIEVSGPSLMRGYLNRPRAEYMTVDGFFRTPDSGYLGRNGHLYFTGRTDDIVRTAGVNVSTTEVEQVLAQNPEVSLAVAVGLPHPSLDQALVACVVPVPRTGPLDGDELLAWLRERLASYKVPRCVLVFDEGELRFTVSQKVRRDHLRELATARVAELGLW
jgi:fatty-acyl-CoA synthase